MKILSIDVQHDIFLKKKIFFCLSLFRSVKYTNMNFGRVSVKKFIQIMMIHVCTNFHAFFTNWSIVMIFWSNRLNYEEITKSKAYHFVQRHVTPLHRFLFPRLPDGLKQNTLFKKPSIKLNKSPYQLWRHHNKE